MSFKNEAAIKRLEVQVRSIDEQLSELKRIIENMQKSPPKKSAK